MWFFKKKNKKNYKTYMIVWQYATTSPDYYTEIVKAKDSAEAWRIIKSEHGISISLVKVKELEELN